MSCVVEGAEKARRIHDCACELVRRIEKVAITGDQEVRISSDCELDEGHIEGIRTRWRRGWR